MMRSSWCIGLRMAIGYVLLCHMACSEKNLELSQDESSLKRRVFRPPPKGEVRAVPPHNIYSGGVGPHELGASFQSTLAHLPQGPQVELYRAKTLFDHRLMWTDNGALVVGVGRQGGGRQEGVAFISVLDPKIARTESGVGIGASMEELLGALGKSQPSPWGGRDARIMRFATLSNVRFIVEKEHVIAALVAPRSLDTPALKGPGGSVQNPASQQCPVRDWEERRANLLKVAAVSEADVDQMIYACLSSKNGDVVVRSGEVVKVIGLGNSEARGGGLQILGTTTIPGLNFISVLETGGERQELYSLSQRHDSSVKEVSITRYTVAGLRINAVWSEIVYKLPAVDASWIGAKLDDADFLVELAGGNGEVIVVGMFMHKDNGVLRHLVPVDTVKLPIRRAAQK